MISVDYKERLDMLVESIGKAGLNDKEFKAMWDILALSSHRIDFSKEYNKGIDEAINGLRKI